MRVAMALPWRCRALPPGPFPGHLQPPPGLPLRPGAPVPTQGLLPVPEPPPPQAPGPPTVCWGSMPECLCPTLPHTQHTGARPHRCTRTQRPQSGARMRAHVHKVRRARTRTATRGARRRCSGHCIGVPKSFTSTPKAKWEARRQCRASAPRPTWAPRAAKPRAGLQRSW